MAERYELIVRGARVLDAAQGLDGPADIAVAAGRIARVGDLGDAPAERELDARGLVASAGWIDLHVHCVAGTSVGAVDPDREAGVATGVTTIVDAGSFGADGLPSFLEVARTARTRVLGYLNVSATRRTPVHGDWQAFDQARTIAAAEAHRDLIVGIKVLASQRHCGNLGLTPVQLAVQASREARTGLMVHIGVAPPLVRDVLNLLGPGDVATHCLKAFPGGLMGRNGLPLAEAWAAASRGVRFDVGHGSGSFCFAAARQALAARFPVHSISTDLHGLSVKGPVYTLARTMAKFLHLGLALPDVVRRVTVEPATTLGRVDALGTLRAGACADVTLFRLARGPITYADSQGATEEGAVDVEPVCTVRGGRVVRDAR